MESRQTFNIRSVIAVKFGEVHRDFTEAAMLAENPFSFDQVFICHSINIFVDLCSTNRNFEKPMNTKKLIVFLLWVFLPMVIVGLMMHFSGASAVGMSEESSAIDPFAAIKGLLFSAGAMLIPLLAVIFTQLIFKEPVLKNLGISFKLNRWSMQSWA